MEKHEWRDRTDDGETRLVTAKFHAGNWSLESRLKSSDDWVDHDPIPLEDLEVLRELLWRKYQRRRVPHSHIESVDALIERSRPGNDDFDDSQVIGRDEEEEE